MDALLLAEEHQVVRLPGPEVVEVDGRLDVLEVGDAHLDRRAEPDLGLRRAVAVHHDDRRGVALVDDPVERHIAEPARGLARLDLQPFPVIGVVQVALAVRLGQAGARHERVVQPAQVDRLDDPEPRHLLGEPSAVAVTGGRVLPVRVDLLVEDGEGGEGDACLPRLGLDPGPQTAVAGGVPGSGNRPLVRLACGSSVFAEALAASPPPGRRFRASGGVFGVLARAAGRSNRSIGTTSFFPKLNGRGSRRVAPRRRCRCGSGRAPCPASGQSGIVLRTDTAGRFVLGGAVLDRHRLLLRTMLVADVG